MRRNLTIVFALVVFSLFVVAVALPQAPAPSSLKDQLTAQYKLAKLGAQSGQIIVKEPGTVLVVQQAGIQGAPLGDLAMPTAQCKDGVLHPPSRGSSFGASMLQGMSRPGSETSGHEYRAFPVGDKVYPSKIDVNLKNDKVLFVVAECADCNGADDAYKAAVSFQFAKGSLANLDVPEVEDVIAKVFSFDTTTSQTPTAQTAPQPEQPATQPGSAPPAPASIQLGQTIDQVVAAIGQPEKIADLGTKKIYTYKDLKVIFANGVVADVQ